MKLLDEIYIHILYYDGPWKLIDALLVTKNINIDVCVIYIDNHIYFSFDNYDNVTLSK